MRINPWSFFKAGCYILIIGAVVHLVGHFWIANHAGQEERHLMELMAAHEKKIAGGSMSMTDILHGLNICYSLFFLFAGTLNLSLVSHSSDRGWLKKASYINAFFYGLGVMISLLYFYWIPVVTFASIMICFALACIFTKTAE